jgi:putative Mn2+ efflux pump MntP
MDLLMPALIGVGLSMDCFAVSLAIGSASRSNLIRRAVLIALCFGGFQAGMTIAGWLAGFSLIGMISAYDHWVAFILLAVVGIKMIAEGAKGEEEETDQDLFRILPLLMLSLATGIDALAVGVSFGVLQNAVLVPAIIIGIVCAGISFTGVMLGERLEAIIGNRTEIAGGLILLLIGIKILAEHLVV